jgi:hypothetical protein
MTPRFHACSRNPKGPSCRRYAVQPLDGSSWPEDSPHYHGAAWIQGFLPLGRTLWRPELGIRNIANASAPRKGKYISVPTHQRHRKVSPFRPLPQEGFDTFTGNSEGEQQNIPRMLHCFHTIVFRSIWRFALPKLSENKRAYSGHNYWARGWNDLAGPGSDFCMMVPATQQHPRQEQGKREGLIVAR